RCDGAGLHRTRVSEADESGTGCGGGAAWIGPLMPSRISVGSGQNHFFVAHSTPRRRPQKIRTLPRRSGGEDCDTPVLVAPATGWRRTRRSEFGRPGAREGDVLQAFVGSSSVLRWYRSLNDRPPADLATVLYFIF